MNWTHVMDEMLKEGRAAGRTLAEIAADFKKAGYLSISRNAVSGRAQRLLDSGVVLPLSRGQKPRKPPLKIQEAPRLSDPLRDRTKQVQACKWPIGDALDFKSCGRPVANEKGPYCAEHCELAHRKPEKNERKETR